MPVIARFYGIVINMYFRQSEHGMPHHTFMPSTVSSMPFLPSNRWKCSKAICRLGRSDLSESGPRNTKKNSSTCGTSRNSDSYPDWSDRNMEGVPKVKSVAARGCTELLVRFENGAEKVYDCRPILSLPQFQLLATPAFFRAVRVDPGGYGISWNDDLDLSEYELWTNGRRMGEE